MGGRTPRSLRKEKLQHVDNSRKSKSPDFRRTMLRSYKIELGNAFKMSGRRIWQ